MNNKKGYTITLVIILVATLVLGIGGFAYYKYKKGKSISPGETAQNFPVAVTSTNLLAKSVLDCQNNWNCFIQAAQNCTPAKFTKSSTIDIFGIKITGHGINEIIGAEGSKCLFYFKNEKTDLAFPPGVSQKIIDEQNTLQKKSDGKDGTCKFNIPDLVSVLKKWEGGNFSSGEITCNPTLTSSNCVIKGGDLEAAECSGTFFDQN